jgi:acyl-homoserine lactone acylase PvdQ
MRSIALALAVALLAALAPTRPAAAPPSFLSILPAGQDGLVPASDPGVRGPHAFDQLEMYAGLVVAVPGLAHTDLLRFFKDAAIAPPPVPESVVSPRPGVTIARDAFGVPHVRGITRDDVFFGAGWATARDRLFLADALRHMGRGRLSEMLGTIPGFGLDFSIGFDRTYYRVAGHSEAELEAIVTDAAARNPEVGPRVLADATAFVDGMNAYIAAARADPSLLPAEYPILGVTLADWKLTDVVATSIAFATVIGFANGGGDEHRNVQLLQALVERFGARGGTRLWDDLRAGEDRDAPVTTRRRFPYMERTGIDPAAVALFDPGSFATRDPIAVAAALREVPPLVPRGMSNWLAITARRAEGGRPILVGGPQTGYFAPQGLIELALEGGGVAARGATPPGLPYVVLGHTPDYAWTATAGGSDLEDIRVERLCTPAGGAENSGTRFQGACVPMVERVDTWMAGADEVTATVLRTVHGPVLGTATVDGEPVVLSRQRANFGREIDSGAAFARLNDNAAQTPAQFRDAMALMTGTLNWVWVSRRDVAFFHSGLYPRRAEGVDPDFPSWGTGEWEWRGLLPAAAQPFDVNPDQGFMTSWNNKPARGWRAADGNHSYTAVYRSQMLDRRLAPLVRRGRVPLAAAVEAMASAATVDLRGQEALPEALPFLKGARDLRRYVKLLRAWLREGAHRIDRDGDGQYEHEAAVALVDAWWDPLVREMFDPQLAGLYGLVGVGFHDSPGNHLGSAFQGGYYGTVKKALRQAAGRRVRGRYRALRCGGGGRAACAQAVQQSLRDAVATLTGRFGSADPAVWSFDPVTDEIRFTLGGLALVAPIPWQNRPTFQQVVQIGD